MARCLSYDRFVDSVIPNEQFNASIQHGPDRVLVKIKEEPPDMDNNEDEMATLTVSHAISNKDVQNATSNTNPVQLNGRLNNKENVWAVSTNDPEKNVTTPEFIERRLRRKRTYSPSENERSKRSRQQVIGSSETTISKKKINSVEGGKKGTENSENITDANSTTSAIKKKNMNVEKSNEARFVCEVCSLTFDTFSLLRDHKHTYSLPWKYECRMCSLRFEARSHLSEHLRCMHHDIPRCDYSKLKVKCHFCNAIFYSKIPLRAHMFHQHPGDAIHKETETQASCQEPPTPEISTLTSNNKDDKMNMSTEEPPRQTKDLTNTPRRLRQMTLTKFLQQSPSTLPVEAISAAKVTNLRKSHSVTPERTIFLTTAMVHRSTTPDPDDAIPSTSKQTDKPRRLIRAQKKPLVKMHADSYGTTNTQLQFKTEPLDIASDIIVDSVEVILTSTDNRTDSISDAQVVTSKIQEVTTAKSTPQVTTTKPIPREENTESQEVIMLSRMSVATRRRSAAMQAQALLKKRYKCKEFTISLKRCDPKSTAAQQTKDNDKTSIYPASQSEPQTAPQVGVNSIEKNDVPLKRVEVFLERLSDDKLHRDVQSCTSAVTIAQNNTRSFKCKFCNKVFTIKKARREHMKLVHMTYMSVLCKARFEGRQKLVNHYLLQHSSASETDCCVCQQIHPSRHALKRHLLVHCIKIVKTQKDTLPLSVETQCDGFPKKYQCTACNRLFEMYLPLKQHRETCNLWKKVTENGTSCSPTTCTEQEEETLEDSANESVDTIVNKSDQNEAQPSVEEIPSDASTEILGTEDETSSGSETVINTSLQDDELLPTSSGDPLEDTSNKNNIMIEGKVIHRNQKLVYHCSVCGLQFQTVKNLWNHRRTYLSTSIELCNICGTVFPSKRFLRTHVNRTHVSGTCQGFSHQCKYCGQGFGKKLTLRMHEAHFHNQQTLDAISEILSKCDNSWNFSTMCSTCHVIFTDYDRFVEHNMYYFDGDIFQCTFCDQSFRGMYLLHHHNKMAHYPEEVRQSYDLTCDVCNEGFKHESHFLAHKAHVHSIGPRALADDLRTVEEAPAKIGPRTFVCPICKLDFTTPEDLVIHEAEFSNQGNYACDKCERRCHTLYALNTHQALSHENGGDTAYKCPTCNEVVMTSVKLMCHEKHFHENNIEQTTTLEEHSQQLFQKIIAPSLESAPTDNVASTSTAPLVQSAVTSQKPTIFVKNAAPVTANVSVENGNRALTKSGNPNSSILTSAKEVVPSTTNSQLKSQSLNCSICSATFRNMKDFIRHRMLYANSGQFQCNRCPRRFMWQSLFREHCIKHAQVKVHWRHICPFCKEGFRYSAILSAHILHLHPTTTPQTDAEDVTNSQPIECEPPQEVVANENGTSDLFSVGPEPEDCETPDEEDAVVNTVESADERLATVKQNNCETPNQPKVTETVDIEEIEPPETEAFSHNSTDLLEISSKLKEELIISTYIESSKFTCPICLSQFQSLNEFQKHFVVNHQKLDKRQCKMSEITSPSSRFIQCVICDRVFCNEDVFRTHLLAVHMPRLRIVPALGKIRTPPAKYQLQSMPVPCASTSDNDTLRSASPRTSKSPVTTNRDKLTVINVDENQRIGKLKVRSLAEIRENLSRDKKSPSPAPKIVRIIAIKNFNDTRVGVPDLKATTPVNLEAKK